MSAVKSQLRSCQTDCVKIHAIDSFKAKLSTVITNTRLLVKFNLLNPIFNRKLQPSTF